MDNHTIVKISHLPEGRDYVWHPDLNLVELSDRLGDHGRRDILARLQGEWLRGALQQISVA